MREEAIQKLEELTDKYEKLNEKIGDPEVMNNSERYQELLQEHAALKKIVERYERYNQLKNQQEEAEEILEMSDDEDMQELAQSELDDVEPKIEKLEEELPLMLLPEDPDDEKDIIVEIRAGAGGDEAGLFAADLYRMYTRYSEGRGWEVEAMSSNESGVGGFKEIIFSVSGDNAYKHLKYESGVHRVQRIPRTESSGRIHTSTATVAVLPEAEEVDVEIDENDLEVGFFRSSGPGGQSVNTTDSAVRITHKPTGVTVSCQDEKSQHKNRERAMNILRARIKEELERQKHQERAEQRRSQVGSGERSEKIRTYNFPQGRVSDHRINLTIHQLEKVLDGELDVLIEPLLEEDRKQKLENLL